MPLRGLIDVARPNSPEMVALEALARVVRDEKFADEGRATLLHSVLKVRGAAGLAGPRSPDHAAQRYGALEEDLQKYQLPALANGTEVLSAISGMAKGAVRWLEMLAKGAPHDIE